MSVFDFLSHFELLWGARYCLSGGRNPSRNVLLKHKLAKNYFFAFMRYDFHGFFIFFGRHELLFKHYNKTQWVLVRLFWLRVRETVTNVISFSVFQLIHISANSFIFHFLCVCLLRGLYCIYTAKPNSQEEKRAHLDQYRYEAVLVPERDIHRLSRSLIDGFKCG